MEQGLKSGNSDNGTGYPEKTSAAHTRYFRVHVPPPPSGGKVPVSEHCLHPYSVSTRVCRKFPNIPIFPIIESERSCLGQELIFPPQKVLKRSSESSQKDFKRSSKYHQKVLKDPQKVIKRSSKGA